MIYGRTNPSQAWECKNVTCEPAIIYDPNSKVIAIPGLLEGLREKSSSGLFFYVYSYQKKERFVFVTTEAVDFLALNNPENMIYSGLSIYVNGALWDLEKQRFVAFNKPEGMFNTFMLYDAGIPNIVFDREEKRYTIFVIEDNGGYAFFKNKARYQPTIVSHLWKNNRIGRPVNNRLIFVTREDADRDSMVILHEEIELDSFNDGVNYVETMPLNTESDSDEAYFVSVHGKDAVGHEIKEAEPYLVVHLVFEDAVIVEQPYNEYNIVFVDGGNVVFDQEFDCVEYDKVISYDSSGNVKKCKENIVRVTYKKNDFENGYATFNLTTGKITH
ncbi:MAG: hypothetical protein IKR04_01200 [Clostridia bacterium]|nr:hypothetical protein [Clostridia bacterium]